MPQPFLPYGQQNITEEDIEAVVTALKQPFLTTGPKVGEFEDAFSNCVGASHSIAVSNGTAAIQLACLALGVQPGDCVLTPSMSFIASTNGAVYCGAVPEFMDCDPDSGLITPETFVAAADRAEASGKTAKVAIIVHINGEHADMAGISREAAKRNIALIEDSCHALGTTFKDHEGNECGVGACRYSAFSTFSTHPVKTITTGEGGLVTTGDAELAKKINRLRNHGMERNAANFMRPELALDRDGNPNPWYYEIQSLGYNYRLTDIASALGLSQLSRMPQIADLRRRLVEQYDSLFAQSDLPLAVIPHQPDTDPVRHLYPVLMDFAGLGIEKSRFVNELREKGIGSQVHYVPAHFHPLYSQGKSGFNLPGSETYYKKVLSLPLYPELNPSDIERVVGTVGDTIAALRT
ncbi:MAG: UDP-4-amino-4,6-dideoxy-N-acetyl-beta-L-altrosamine transaminase [Pseudomonadota bacterium]